MKKPKNISSILLNFISKIEGWKENKQEVDAFMEARNDLMELIVWDYPSRKEKELYKAETLEGKTVFYSNAGNGRINIININAPYYDDCSMVEVHIKTANKLFGDGWIPEWNVPF